MQTDIKNLLLKLFKDTLHEECDTYIPLPISGSARQYYRLNNNKRSIIGTYNTDLKENTAFIHFSKVFKRNKINVPEIYAADLKKNIYLQEDLGDETLYDIVKQSIVDNNFPENIIEYYKTAVEQLAELQINAGKEIDYNKSYPRPAFDRQSIMWDLNYFKYDFLKFTDVSFDEQLLENDFDTFSNYLTSADSNYFLFRDFKSKNIMIKNSQIYFIDYQGGRKGAVQYDLASLLFDAADIPLYIKEDILDHYISYTDKYLKSDNADFKKYFYAFSLIRILQVLGAYGFRGLFEKKQHFIESIPTGLKNIKILIERCEILNNLPELKRVLVELTVSTKLKELYKGNILTVSIKSFSFKKGIPYDKSGNGGGHIFDCRFINNPGRIEKYKDMNGKDDAIIEFLEKQNESSLFFESVKQILNDHIKNFVNRNFSHISVNFGCTGGRHRSVYFAEKTAEYIRNNFNINTEIIHTEGF